MVKLNGLNKKLHFTESNSEVIQLNKLISKKLEFNSYKNTWPIITKLKNINETAIKIAPDFPMIFVKQEILKKLKKGKHNIKQDSDVKIN